MGGEGAVLRHPPSAVVDHKAAAENGIKSEYKYPDGGIIIRG